MDRDRNLLFGIFAVQLGRVASTKLVEAAAAWATDPSRDLASRLVEAGSLNEDDRVLLDGLVTEAVARHGGNAAQTLAKFGGEGQVYSVYCGTLAPQSDGSIALAPEQSPILGDLRPGAKPGVEEAPGRYTQLGEVGRGGMGRVLLIHDDHLSRDIVMKELLPELLVDSGGAGEATIVERERAREPTPVSASMLVLSRFFQEARITGQLEHPSIVPVYELGHRKDGTLYYTMKLVRGKTLTEAIRAERTLQGRLGLLPHFIDLCQAVAYAHSRRIIHRDLKPDNVMVGEFGETVVLDWGLAKGLDAEDRHADALAPTFHALKIGNGSELPKTTYGRAMGTPMYMPPEQVRGKLELIDERSDTYSLGAILHELLTGSPPFTGKTIGEILHKVLNEKPRPVREHVADAPRELIAVCEKALSKQPRERYASARELAEDIQRFQSGALVQAYDYGLGEHLKRWAGKNKTALTIATTAMLIILAAFGYSYFSILQANEAERQQRVTAEGAQSVTEAALANLELKVAELRRAGYLSGIWFAENNINSRNLRLAHQRLMQTPEEYRNWEWGHLFLRLDRPELIIVGHQAPPNSAAFSLDGKRIVTASNDGTATVWDSATGREILSLAGHRGHVIDASFSPDGKCIVTASRDATAKVWDAETGAELTKFIGHVASVFSASFSPDGNRIVSTSWRHAAKVWDAMTGQELLTLTGHQATLWGASFSPEGRRIVTASYDGTAKIWDAETGIEILTLTGHRNVLRSAFFSPDGKRIVTASDDRTAKIWDTETGKEILTLAGQQGPLHNANFSPDGKRIVTASRVGTAKLWDAETGQEILTLVERQDDVNSASFSPDGKRIVTTSREGAAVWDAEIDQASLTLAGHRGIVNSASFSLDGKRIVTVSRDATAKVWDAETGAELTKFIGHVASVNSASFSPDGKRVVSTSWRHAAKVWDAMTGQELLTLTGHRDGLSGSSFSPDGKRIVTASWDVTAKVWDAKTGQEILTLTGHQAPLNSALFSPDGTRIVTASLDGTAMVWNAETGKSILRLAGHQDRINSAAFSPEGKRIVTTSDDKSAQVWDAETGQEILTLVGHQDVVNNATFSPDGSRIVTASGDHTARLWDAGTGQEILALVGHHDALNGAAISPDGKRIVTVSDDGTAKVWDAAPWEPGAWQDTSGREQLTQLALREPPMRDYHHFATGPEIQGHLDDLETMVSALETLADNPNSTKIGEIAGQGISIEDATALPLVEGLDWQNADLLVRVNRQSVDTVKGAARLLRAALRKYDGERGNPLALRFDIANTYDYRVSEITFSGVVNKHLHFSEGRILALLKRARGRFDDDLERVNEANETESFDDSVSDQFPAPFGLAKGDRLQSIDEIKFTGLFSVVEALETLQAGIERGKINTFDIVVYRKSADQHITTTVTIED